MIDEESQKRFYEKMRPIIESEMTPQGDLLPVWMRYPQIPRYSIGWRMGAGESYMWAWDAWADRMERGQLVEYFKRYMPIPNDWIDWVADRLGFPNVGLAIIMDEGNVEDVRWLEEQGLVNYSEFKAWFENRSKE
jgi:hypothetical protein